MGQINNKFYADDWGISPGVNDGIIELVKYGLIKSVSILVDGEFVNYKLDELLKHGQKIEFSLHFNLTFNKKTNSIIKLLLAIGLFDIGVNEIKKEFERQIDMCNQLGIKLVSVDGHHHVHLIPIVFRTISKNFEKYGILKYRIMNDFGHLPSYLISCWHSLFLKNNGFEKVKLGYLINDDFDSHGKLEHKLNKYQGLICHPAQINDFDKYNISDKLRIERVIEFNKLLEKYNEK